MRTRRTGVVLGALAAGLLCAVAAQGAPRDPVLAQVDRLVVANFHSPEVLASRRWERSVRRADRALAKAKDAAARTVVFRELLASLATSHTDYFAPHDPRHADLAAIFQRVIESTPDRCPSAKRPALPVEVDGIGVWWLHEGGAWFVAGVLDGGPAAKAGLVGGHEVVAADGAPFDPVRAFAGKAGKDVALAYRASRDAEPVRVSSYRSASRRCRPTSTR